MSNLAQTSLIKGYWILRNARVIASIVSELLKENQQGKITPPTQIRVTPPSQIKTTMFPIPSSLRPSWRVSKPYSWYSFSLEEPHQCRIHMFFEHTVFLKLRIGWFSDTRNPSMVVVEGPRIFDVQCIWGRILCLLKKFLFLRIRRLYFI